MGSCDGRREYQQYTALHDYLSHNKACTNLSLSSIEGTVLPSKISIDEYSSLPFMHVLFRLRIHVGLLYSDPHGRDLDARRISVIRESIKKTGWLQSSVIRVQALDSSEQALDSSEQGFGALASKMTPTLPAGELPQGFKIMIVSGHHRAHILREVLQSRTADAPCRQASGLFSNLQNYDGMVDVEFLRHTPPNRRYELSRSLNTTGNVSSKNVRPILFYNALISLLQP